MQRVAIVDWAQTRHAAERADVNYAELVHEVVAHFDRDAFETVVTASSDFYDGRTISNIPIQDVVASPIKSESKVSMDGAFAMLYGWMRVASGEYSTCLVVAHSKLSEGEQRKIANAAWDPIVLRPLGLDDWIVLGMQARRYLMQRGVSPEVFEEAAKRSYEAAAKNPNAHRRAWKPSDVVADPLRLMEIAPDSDGAAAVLLASESAAKKFPGAPVWITGVGTCYDVHSPGHRELADSKALRSAAEQAFRLAGTCQIDVAEVHDLSACQTLLWKEILGLSTCNESGGALATHPGFATGLVRVIEVASRLREGAGRTGLAHGMTGPLGQAQCVWMLSV